MSSLKRIAIDARFYRKSTAGVGRYTRGLIHHLQKIDAPYDYTVILTPEDYKEWPKDTLPSNWHTEVLPIRHYSKAEQTELLNYLNKQKFDLVHFTMFNHPIRYTRPFVVTIHDLTMTLFPLKPFWHPKTLAYRYIMQHAAETARHIIVPSQATAKDVHSMLKAPQDKVTVTYEAVEPEFVPQDNPKHFETLKKKYKITKPFLFFVNQWRPHKGLPDLVSAFELASEQEAIQLLLAGKPNTSFPTVVQAVESAKQRTVDILTPGFISDEDMISLYSMATAFIFPSHYEGFGLGALEAISCGCPTIAAENSCLPEVLGDAAVYFQTGNIDQLHEAITRVSNDKKLQEQLRHKGFDQAKKFSFDTMAKQTLSVYKSLIA